MRDAREERNGKLYGLYADMISKLEAGVISGSEISISRRRLIESFCEDIDRRSRDKPGLDFEIKHDPNTILFSLVASDNNGPIATIGKKEPLLDRLLEKIARHRDLPIMGDVAGYLKEYRVSNETDDSEWYRVKTHAVETLETKYGLQKRSNGLVAV